MLLRSLVRGGCNIRNMRTGRHKFTSSLKLIAGVPIVCPRLIWSDQPLDHLCHKKHPEAVREIRLYMSDHRSGNLFCNDISGPCDSTVLGRCLPLMEKHTSIP